MKSPLNKKFFPEGSLSREDLLRYQQGQLSAEERTRIESILTEDEFSSEAFEGLENDPTALADLPMEFSSLQNKTTSNSIYKKLFLGACLVALITSVIAIYYSSQNSSLKKEQANFVSRDFDEKNKTDLTITTKEEIREIETAEPIAQKEQITYDKTVANQAKTIEEIKIEPKEVITVEVTDPKTIETKQPEVIEKKLEDKVARSNVKFTYYHDLKVVDYSGLYTGGIKKTEFNVNSGTPANLIDKNSKNELEPEFRTVYIPYEKYLESSMLEFSKNDFKSALKNYKIILQHYPEDLNAFFYGALCYYNLGKFDKAINYFDKCIYNSFSTFEEEAEWYKALSFIKNKQKEEANYLLNKIAKQSSFYSERARQKLKEINP